MNCVQRQGMKVGHGFVGKLMADDQELNSLSRFRKRSDRLVLEEHSHCEVPAGCGGVVLRWRNPLATFGLTVHLYSPVEANCYLDGKEVRRGRQEVAPGRHVIAIHLTSADLRSGLLLFAATPAGFDTKETPATRVTEATLRIVSADDGTWKFTLDRPADDAWHQAAFDDSTWLALSQRPTPQLERGAPGAYQCAECVEDGAICLGLPQLEGGQSLTSWWRQLFGGSVSVPWPQKGDVWVRKVFEVSPPEVEAPK